MAMRCLQGLFSEESDGALFFELELKVQILREFMGRI